MRQGVRREVKNPRLLLADLQDENDSQRVKARLAWRRRMADAGARLADEVELGRRAGTEKGVQARSRSLPSGPSRNDPMPALLFVATIAGALIWILAIFGLISIGQFLQRVFGG